LKDPRGGDRGTDPSAPANPVNKIDQTKGMIFSQDQSEPAFSEEMVDRLAWADETKRIIDRIANPAAFPSSSALPAACVFAS